MKTVKIKPLETNSKLIVLGFYEDKKELSEIQMELDKKFLGVISSNILKNFSGKFNEILTFPLENGVKIVALGLGKYGEFTSKKLRELVVKNYSSIQKLAADGTISFEHILNDNVCKKCLISSVPLGVNLGNYKFDKYKTKKQDKKVENIELLTLTDDSDLDEAINMAEIISNSMNFTKDLVFESAEIMTPNKVSEIATDLAKNYNVTLESHKSYRYFK